MAETLSLPQEKSRPGRRPSLRAWSSSSAREDRPGHAGHLGQDTGVAVRAFRPSSGAKADPLCGSEAGLVYEQVQSQPGQGGREGRREGSQCTEAEAGGTLSSSRPAWSSSRISRANETLSQRERERQRHRGGRGESGASAHSCHPSQGDCRGF